MIFMVVCLLNRFYDGKWLVKMTACVTEMTVEKDWGSHCFLGSVRVVPTATFLHSIEVQTMAQII